MIFICELLKIRFTTLVLLKLYIIVTMKHTIYIINKSQIIILYLMNFYTNLHNLKYKYIFTLVYV